MRLLLWAGILGFSFWILSELLEIYLRGYNPTVYYLTAAYHVFAGFGIWGLHKAQSGQGRNTLSLVGAAIAFIAYVGVIYFPIAVLNSGLSIAEFLDANPLYAIPGVLWFVGMLLFGISLLTTRHFPTWSGSVFVLGTIIFTATPLLNGPALLANVTNIIFAGTVISLCLMSLGRARANP